MRRSRSMLVALATSVFVVCGSLVGAGFALATGLSNDHGSAPAGAGPVPAAVAPATMENSFVPITPCRIIDTRAGGGNLAAGVARNFYITGSVGFPAQGGTSGGCGVPSSATSVMVSVSSVNVTGVGYFRAWPYNATPPNATIAHYEPGPITTTGGTMTLAPKGSAHDVTIKAFGASAGIVVDVTGYFAPQMAAFISIEGDLVYATSRVVSATRESAGVYTVVFDTDVSQCSFTVTPYAFNYPFAVGPSISDDHAATVYVHDEPITTHYDTSFFIQATC